MARRSLHRQRRATIGLLSMATWLGAVALQPRPARAQDAAPPVPTPTPAPDTSAPPGPVPAAQPPAGFEPGTPVVRPAGPIFPAPPMESRRQRRSTAMMVTGIVSTALGAVALGVGAGLWGNAEQQQLCATDSTTGHGELNLMNEPGCSGRETQSTVGIGMMIGGGAAIALGVPLLVVGARSVPVEGKVGVGAASMRFRF